GTQPSGAVTVVSPAQTATLSAASSEWWFHVRARDVAGNLGAVAHLGPFMIDNGPPSISSFVINNDAPATTIVSTGVLMTASNSASGLSQMRFKNDGGVFSAWQPYNATASWNLTSDGGSTATGTRTVTVEVK